MTLQDTDEWRQARCGSLGASIIGKAIERQKRSGERYKSSLDLMFQLAADRIIGQPKKWVNPLHWGVDNEAAARATYAAFYTNLEVREVPLPIPHPTIPYGHCSPDALVGDEGGLEIKCPTSSVHLQTLVSNAIPEEHLPQIFWSLACTGRQWWDYASFDRRFEPKLQMFVKRVWRDDKAIALLEEEARQFLAELNGKVEIITERYGLDRCGAPGLG